MRKYINMMNEWSDYDEDGDEPWPTETIPVGTILYHGTSEDFSPSDIETAAWFSRSREVAEYFANRYQNGGEPVIHAYRVEEPITLPVIHDKNELDEFSERFYIHLDSPEDIIDSMRSNGQPGWIIPDNYHNGDDILNMDTRHCISVANLDEEVLDEAPISDITHLGNWEKNSGFRDQDRKLLTNPKAITKIKSMWRYPDEVDYNVILLNNPEGNRHTEIGDIGDINSCISWLQNNMPKTAPEIIENLKGDEVNIIFTNNKGAARVPMTGWIAAHRFGHAIFRFGRSHYYEQAAKTLDRYLGDLAQQYGIRSNAYAYAQYKHLESTTSRNLMSAICSFKSARDGKLRNTFEAVHELFAQYIFTGELTFNDIPHTVKIGNVPYSYRGGDDYDYDNRAIKDDLAMELKDYFETAIHYAVGRVYVM